MSTIASLNISIGADASQFTSVISAVISKLGEMAETGFQTIESTARLASTLALNTEELSGFHHAADRAGVSTETFDNGIQKMLVNLGKQTPETAKALDMLGLSLDDLSGSTGDKFTKISDAISHMSSPAQRAAVAVELFGKAGAELLPVLNEGKEGLAEMAEESEALGDSISGIDSAKIEVANDDFKVLGELISAAGQHIAVELSPYLDYVVDQVNDFAVANGGMAQIVSSAFHQVNEAIGWVINTMDLLKAGWYGFQTVVSGVVDFLIVGPLRAFAYFVDSIVVNFQNAINKLITAANYLGAGLKNISVNDTGLSNAVDSLHKELQQNVVDGAKGFSDSMSDYLSGKGHDDWLKFTDGIADNFQKKAQLVADKHAADLAGSAGELDGASGKLEKSGAFKELDLAHISVAGIGAKKQQEVTSPQIVTALNTGFAGLTKAIGTLGLKSATVGAG